MPGITAKVWALWTMVEAPGRRIRGLLLRLAAPALDALHEHRLLAQHVRASERLHLDVDVAPAAQDVLAEIAGVGRFGDRGLERGDGLGRVGVQGDDDLGSANRDGGDGRSFENGVGVALEQDAIGEDGGVGLVGVDDDVAAVGRGEGADAPLLAGWEARSAAASQAGGGQGGHDLAGRHGLDGLDQALESAGRNCGLDVGDGRSRGAAFAGRAAVARFADRRQ